MKMRKETLETENKDVGMGETRREGRERLEEAKKNRIEDKSEQGILGDVRQAMRTAVECRRAVKDMTQRQYSKQGRM